MFATAAAVAVALVSGAAQAAPTPTHSYEFSGNLQDSFGGPPMALNPGAPTEYSGAGVSQGFEFAANQGPNLSNAFAASDVYSIEMFFSLDDVSGSYRRLVDFKDHSTDEGLYFLNNSLVLYNTNQPTEVDVVGGRMLHLVLTRAADDAFKVYFNAGLALNLADTLDRTTLTGPNRIVRFFDDEGSGESSAGFVDYIRTYDTVLSQADVTALYNRGAPLRVDGAGAVVPEPGAWALMILGFGATGSALRARRRTVLVG